MAERRFGSLVTFRVLSSHFRSSPISGHILRRAKRRLGNERAVACLGDALRRSSSMAEYAQRFAENDIDFAKLSGLTDQDLETIGVASLGHRRKLLHAINAERLTHD